ncbi:hypothetical protein AA958_30510 [Streptomyces sp. CNQ-509]|nr:hypothetical protein AA958_30510 [Streptomyces sp. CNQ-509]
MQQSVPSVCAGGEAACTAAAVKGRGPWRTRDVGSAVPDVVLVAVRFRRGRPAPEPYRAEHR